MKNNLLILALLLMAGCSAPVENDLAYVPPVPESTPANVVTQTKTESGEEKAVRLAEEFVKRNGYTDAPADKEHLTLELIEWESDTDKMLAARKSSLEPKAYGVSAGAKLSEKGWTVVFRHQYDKVDKKQNLKTGLAVTMDENFENLKMEHKEFFLDKVEKKFP